MLVYTLKVQHVCLKVAISFGRLQSPNTQQNMVRTSKAVCTSRLISIPKTTLLPTPFRNAMILSPLKLPVATKPSNRRNPSKWTLGWHLKTYKESPNLPTKRSSCLLSNHNPKIYMFLVKLLISRVATARVNFWGFATTHIALPVSLVACLEQTCRWTQARDIKERVVLNMFLMEAYGIHTNICIVHTKMHIYILCKYKCYRLYIYKKNQSIWILLNVKVKLSKTKGKQDDHQDMACVCVCLLP